jgi:hypothetical protein
MQYGGGFIPACEEAPPTNVSGAFVPAVLLRLELGARRSGWFARRSS